MIDSPAKFRDSVLSYSVYSEGHKVNDKFDLTFAEVRLGLNKIGKATLKFNAGDMDAQIFEEVDEETFKPGKKIQLGLGDVNSEIIVFEGIVVEIGIEVDKGMRSQMVVECRDCLYPATQVRCNAIFENKTDSDVIKEILGTYGSVDIETTSYKHESLVQYYCTDWDFVLSRADVNGMFVSVNSGKISVGKPKIDGKAVLMVSYGNDLIEFDGSVVSGKGFDKVEAVSWLPAQQTVVNALANQPKLNKQGNLTAEDLKNVNKQLRQTDANKEKDVLQSWADATALKTGLARFKGSMTFYGSAKVIPGCMIQLEGMGKRFCGNVFVGSVEHRVENNVWTTKVFMGVDGNNITDEPDVVAPPASGWLPGIEGLHIGKVKQISDDPSDDRRILVELPLFGGNKKEIWMRHAVLYAGSGYGIFFLPEKGDEVVVGFFNNDPCCPVVLGCMYSKKQSSDFKAEAGNDIKAIVSREKMKILFDEKKKIITIQTPAGNKIEISDEGKSVALSDENKNEIKLDKSGIMLKSAKDITLKSQGNITLDATAKVTVSAKSDTVIEAMNVKATGKVGFSAKGNATAEISASGQTTVKGGIVMIN
ncbi:MAG: type VI secretion system tip protein VgrG [Culturomica sp.]|jgi:Rhs element Vgr protein|nr:type VI secretion system tip protein VgrG [Culturomica sp.]